MLGSAVSRYWPLILQGGVSIGFCGYFVMRADAPLHFFDYLLFFLAVMVILTTLYVTSRGGGVSSSAVLKTLEEVNNLKNLKSEVEPASEAERELAEHINKLLRDMKNILNEANGSSEQLFEAGAKLSASSAEIALASDTQSDLANQMNQSIHNLSLGIANVTQHATNTLSITRETFTLCEQGENQAKEVIQGVTSVNDTFNNIGSLIHSLAQRSEEIAGIITVIGEIADQTNLLALNAAIEAARAGEQGRGFAVVADEVRGLAERTRSATVQVTEMVTAICSETKQVVTQMDESKETVERCVDLTERTSSVLGSILEKAADVEARTNEIASSSEEQSYSSTEIETTINQISEMSTNINQSIHHSNEEMRNLLRMTADMVVNIREYKTTHTNELTSIRDCITLIRMNAILAANAAAASEAARPIEEIRVLDSRIESLWRDFNSSALDAELKVLSDKFYDLWGRFKEARSITLAKAAEGDFSAARHNASTNAGPKFQDARQALEQAISSSLSLKG